MPSSPGEPAIPMGTVLTYSHAVIHTHRHTHTHSPTEGIQPGGRQGGTHLPSPQGRASLSVHSTEGGRVQLNITSSGFPWWCSG